MAKERFLGDEAVRLLRTNWRSKADLLAKELYAIFANMFPRDGITQPITINRNSEEPAITIRQNGDFTSPAISVVNGGTGEIRTGDSVINLGDLTTNPRTPPQQQQVQTSGVFPGTIESYLGDRIYKMNLFTNGIDSASTVTVNVRQMQIEGEPMPVGAAVPVFYNVLTDGSGNEISRFYWMQAPIWMSPPPPAQT